MVRCGTCRDKGYLGLKAHESPLGMDNSRPCPDCGGSVGGSKVSISPAYRVVVPRGRTLSQAIRVGCYDWVSEDINEKKFAQPPKRYGRIALQLVLFGVRITVAEAVDALDRRGFEPADIWEILAFGEYEPSHQRQFDILALGSPFVNGAGLLCHPSLYGSQTDRNLGLCKDGIFRYNCRFLAVKRKP